MKKQIILLLTLLSLAFPQGLSAAVFEVNSTSDAQDDNIGDGKCETVDGACTLRAAISEANALDGPDEVRLMAGEYKLIGQYNDDENKSGDLDITSPLSIVGSGTRETIIRQTAEDRVIHIINAGEISISDVTITGGLIKDNLVKNGGGILNEISDMKKSNLLLYRVSILGNIIAADGGSGGGVFSQGSENSESNIVIESSIIRNNFAEAGKGGGGFFGNGYLKIINSTIVFNEAGARGGIHNALDGEGSEIINSAIVFNTAFNGQTGGLEDDAAPDTIIRNSIIAQNDASTQSEGRDDCYGIEKLSGYNIIGKNCFIDNFTSTDMLGTDLNPLDPVLGPLRNNGGPTDTHALLAGSPAIGVVPAEECPEEDQRGFKLPEGQPCSIGPFQIICGDAVVSPGEECDDGNNTNGDGCSATCVVEPGANGSSGGGCELNAHNNGKSHKAQQQTAIFYIVGIALFALFGVFRKRSV